MGKSTAISWCHHTFNIWWGCDHAEREPGSSLVSPECENCYAQAFDRRVGGAHWGPDAEPRWFGDAYWEKPLRWNEEARKAGERRRVFCASMADWAQRHGDPAINAKMDAARMRLWRLIRETPWLDWLLLTKRADRLLDLLPWTNLKMNPPKPFCRGCADTNVRGVCDSDGMPCAPREPWPNVWIGVTCGARSSLWRVHRLREVPAHVRFVSGEPLVENITSDDWDEALRPEQVSKDGHAVAQIDWLIVGDESGAPAKGGPGIRPAEVDWIRTARAAAERNRVAFHFKQWAGDDADGITGARKGKGKGGKIHLPILDGVQWAQFPEVSHG